MILFFPCLQQGYHLWTQLKELAKAYQKFKCDVVSILRLKLKISAYILPYLAQQANFSTLKLDQFPVLAS